MTRISRTGGEVPDFFIVGHPKSGTTAMWTMLRRHPEIFMPDKKEPSFFVPEILTHPRDLATYVSLFAAAAPQQRTGEATPAYLWSHSAAGRIAEMRPDARVIALFREPASFLRSLHLEFLRIHAETEKDLRKALALEEQRAEGKAIPRDSTRPLFLQYAEHIRYTEQLRRFHAVFPPEQVLVLIYEEFRTDNVRVMQQVLQFLGVDDSIEISSVEVNPTYELRSPRISELVRSLYLGRDPISRAGKAAIKAATSSAFRKKAMAAQRRAQLGRPSPVDVDLMRELRQRFHGEVVELGNYLGRDLVKLWGYDRLERKDALDPSPAPPLRSVG